MLELDYLEIHLAHTCNLFCPSCSHYSQHHVGGLVAFEDIQSWILNWKTKVLPRQFGLLGGEPTMNPALCQIIEFIHQHWPKTQIILKTNGFFLERHKKLREVLAQTGAQIEINYHANQKDYLNRFSKILDHVVDWYDVKVVLKNSFGGVTHKNWTQRYLGYGSSLAPFEDNNPDRSWELCVARHSLVLFKNRLWKCPPIAYLGLMSEHFKLSSKWDRYLKYSGLAQDCSEQELFEFVNRKAEDICSMCPSREITIEKGNPLVRPDETPKS